MSIAITNQGAIGASSGTSLAFTLTASIAAGSSIVVAGTTNGTTLGSVTDDVGNTYTLLKSGNPNGSTGNGITAFWVCHNCIAINSGQNVTWSRTPSTSWVLAVGSLAGGPFATDINLAPVTGLSALPSISSGVLGSASEAVFSVLGTSATAGADTFTQVSGWTVPFANGLATGGGPAVRGGSIVVSSTNSVTYNPTITSRPWVLLLASFKISSTITSTKLNADGTASVNFTGNEIASARLNADGTASVSFTGQTPKVVLIGIVNHSLLSVIKSNRLSTTNKILPFTVSGLLSCQRIMSKLIQFPRGSAGGFGIGFGRGFQTVSLGPSMTVTVSALRQGFIFNRTVTFATNSLLSLKKSVSKLRSFASQTSVALGRVFPKLIVLYPKGSVTGGFGRGFGVGFQIPSVLPSMTVTLIERVAKGRTFSLTNPSNLALQRKTVGKVVSFTNSSVLSIRRIVSKIVLFLFPSTIRITSFIRRTISLSSSSVLNFSKSMSRTRIILSPVSIIFSRRIAALTKAFNTPQSTTLLRASPKIFNFNTISSVTASLVAVGASFLISLSNSQIFSISVFKPANTKTFNLITSPTLVVTRNLSKTIALSISVIQNFVRLLFFRPINITQNQQVTSQKLFYRVFNFPTTVISSLVKFMTKAAFILQTQQIISRLSVIVKSISIKSSEIVTAVKQVSKAGLVKISSNVSFVRAPGKASLLATHSLLSLRTSVSKVFAILSPSSLLKVTRFVGKPLLIASRSSIILSRRLSTIITIVTLNIVSSAQGSKGLVVISTREIIQTIKSTNKSVQTLLLPEQLTLQKSRDRILTVQQFLALTLTKSIARLSAYQTRVSQTFNVGIFRQFTVQTPGNVGFLKSFIRTINLTTASLVKVPQVIKILLKDTQVITTLKISTKRIFTLQTEVVSVGFVARTRLFVVHTGQSVVMKTTRISNLMIMSVSGSVLSVVKTIRRTLKYITTSAIFVIAPRGYKITLQLPETVRLTRSNGRLLIAKIRESVNVHSGANRIFTVATHQKVITGKLWKRLIINYSTGVTSSVIHKYGKVILIIQSTAISVYTKIRTLIQKAVILLVGA